MAEKDRNGFKEIKDNPLSKVGVFPYLGKEIPGAPDPTAIYYVYRPEEELAHPDCINSFKLLPWVDEHTLLGDLPGAVPAEQKGVHGVIGEEVYFKDGYLRGNLKLFSKTLGQLIEDKEKIELSCGYTFNLDPTPGSFMGEPYQYVQRRIRGNHLALVQEGRMGPEVYVQDSKGGAFTFTLDSKELLNMADENSNAGGEEGGGNASSMTLADVIKQMGEILPMVAKLQEMVAALQGAAAPAAVAEAVDEETDKDAAIAAMDAEIKGLKKQLETVQAGALTTKAVLADVAKRDALASDLSKVVGAFDHSVMTVQDVAAFGVKELELDCKPGYELPVLEGYLKGRQKSTPTFTTKKVAVAADGKPVANPIDDYLNGKGAA